jgi:hypothetical protein
MSKEKAEPIKHGESQGNRQNKLLGRKQHFSSS